MQPETASLLAAYVPAGNGLATGRGVEAFSSSGHSFNVR
jgi:hypothetical protein